MTGGVSSFGARTAADPQPDRTATVTTRQLQQAFDHAELHADTRRLHQLLADDFVSIGERAFHLDKREWIDRHAAELGRSALRRTPNLGYPACPRG